MRSWGVAIGMMGPKFWQIYRKDGLMKAILRGKPLRLTHEKAGFGDELAACVGKDEFGNRYYEDWNGKNKNQRRFVEYADNAHWHPSQVKKMAPAWQGWMHYMYDDPPKVSHTNTHNRNTQRRFTSSDRKTTSWILSTGLVARWCSSRTIPTPTRTRAT